MGAERRRAAPGRRDAGARHVAGHLLLRVRRPARAVGARLRARVAAPRCRTRSDTCSGRAGVDRVDTGRIRCRTASNRTMPAATATLRLSDAPGMGIETSSSAASRQPAETPWRSLPTTTATGPHSRASQHRRSASGVATTMLTPRSRSHGTAALLVHSATGRWKRVPTEPRTASGWKTPVRPSQASRPVAPDEQAERTSVPRLPGRSIPSATRSSGRSSSATVSSVVGQRRATASTPSGRVAVEIERKAPAPSETTRAPRRSASVTSSSSALPRNRSGAA